MLQERVLETIALDRINFHIRSDSPATVYRATAVGQLYFFVSGITDAIAIEVIVVKRDIAVVALNQAAARRVVLCRGQCEASVIRKWIHRLNQTFAEGDLANDQPPIVVLNRSGHNLRR